MKKSLSTKDYVFVGLISVIFGIIYFGTTLSGTAITALLTPFGYGWWVMNFVMEFGIWRQ